MNTTQPTQNQLIYRTQRTTLQLADAKLELETLINLDQTIDDLFDLLSREGKPELLEDLCPYFGVVWPAAQGLAQAISEIPAAQLQSQRILEIGCGLAIPSLVAALRGARITATDSHPEVERFLKTNLELNALHGKVEYLRADWRAHQKPGVLPRFDRIIASDILYERTFAVEVAQFIDAHLEPGGSAWVADPGRPYLQPFADEMKRLGYRVATEAFGENIFVLKCAKGS